MVWAAAIRARPSGVFGPVERPPCHLHFCFPRAAAKPHWSPVRLDLALHRRHRIRPPQIVMKVLGKLGCFIRRMPPAEGESENCSHYPLARIRGGGCHRCHVFHKTLLYFCFSTTFRKKVAIVATPPQTQAGRGSLVATPHGNAWQPCDQSGHWSTPPM